MTPYGHYVVAGQTYQNKFKAFEHSVPKGQFPHWNFFDQDFAKVDWHIEPSESLLELYRQRAVQIRAEYDYIILWYSGGSDSHTALQSFLSNGIHIDEIWHRSSVDRVARTDLRQDSANQANETRHVVLPMLKKIQALHPEIRIRVFDAMDLAIDYWNTSGIHIDHTNYLNPLLPAKMSSEFFTRLGIQGRVAKITALDKPRLYISQGSWYFSFLDLPLLTQLMQNRVDCGEQDVCFYWHPDAANIMIKQAHQIAKWFDCHADLEYLMHKDVSCQDRDLRNSIIKSIIYPHWDIHTWQVQKPPNDIGHPEFFWFYSDESNTAYKNWRRSVDTYSNECQRLFTQAPSLDLPVSLSFSEGFHILPGCQSHPYFIKHSSHRQHRRASVDQ